MLQKFGVHPIIFRRRLLLLALICLFKICLVIAIAINNNGLTKIPSGIRCLEGILNFRRNSICRLEAHDFLCFTKVQVLDDSCNNITYIHDDTFFPLVSMRRLTVKHNRFLGNLPEYMGPFVPTMLPLRMQFIGLQYLRPTFFHQFHGD